MSKEKRVKCSKYCSAFGCPNRQDHERNLGFFRMPTDPERRREWAKAIDREDLLQEGKESKLRNSVVCSDHFEESSIISLTTKRVAKDAVPSKNPINLISVNPPVADENTLNSESINLPTTNKSKSKTKDVPKVPEVFIFDTPPLVRTATKRTQTEEEEIYKTQPLLKKKLVEEMNAVKIKNRRLERELIKIKKELEAKDAALLTDSEDGIAQRFVKLVEWQNKLKRKAQGNRYDREYKRFALNLSLSSPRAYRCLKTVLQLPSKNTLTKIEIKIPTKIEDRVLESLSMKLDSLPTNAKYCTICVGEMELKRSLFYDTKTDEIIGLHNINGNRSLEVASIAYVVMLQGIHCDWKQPVAYALRGSADTHDQFDSWINEVILKLFSVGIEVKALVTVQDSYFDTFAKEKKNVTIDEPYFFVEGHKIYYIFDVPHLLKSMRNCMLSSDFYYEEDEISWDYIKILYEHQKEKDFRLIPQLTKAHLKPNNSQKSDVKYAAQVFSATVHAALETYIDFGKIAEEARGTAKFIRLMNDLFDILNSSQSFSRRKLKNENKYQDAFKMSPDQMTILQAAQHMFATIRSTKYDNTEQTNTFQNFLITIQSVMQLFEDSKSEGFEYLLTRRLNQDNMISLFENIRKGTGQFYMMPTSNAFAKAFSKTFYAYVLENDDNNTESDIYEMLLKAENIINKKPLDLPEPPQKTAVAINNDINYRIDLPETYALTYVANFLMAECTKQHVNCRVMNEKLDCGRLKVTEEMSEYIKKIDTVFVENFESNLLGNIGCELMKLLTEIPEPPLPCKCFPLNFLLRLFVRLRIFTTNKYNNNNFKQCPDIVQYVKVKPL